MKTLKFLITFLLLTLIATKNFAGQEGGGGFQVLDENGRWKVEEAFIEVSANKLTLTEPMKEMIRFVAHLMTKYGVNGSPLSSPKNKYPVDSFFVGDMIDHVRYVFVDTPEELKQKCKLQNELQKMDNLREVGCTSPEGTSYVIRKYYNQYADLKNQFLGLFHVRLQHWCSMVSGELGWNCRDNKSHRYIKEFVAATNILLDTYERQARDIKNETIPAALSKKEYDSIELTPKLAMLVGLNAIPSGGAIDRVGGGIVALDVKPTNSFVGLGSVISPMVAVEDSLLFMTDMNLSGKIKNVRAINSKLVGGRIEQDIPVIEDAQLINSSVKIVGHQDKSKPSIKNVKIEDSEILEGTSENALIVASNIENSTIKDVEIPRKEKLVTTIRKSTVINNANVAGATVVSSQVDNAQIAPTCKVTRAIFEPGSSCGENVDIIYYETYPDYMKDVVFASGSKVTNIKIVMEKYGSYVWSKRKILFGKNSTVQNLNIILQDAYSKTGRRLSNNILLGLATLTVATHIGWHLEGLDALLTFPDNSSLDFAMDVSGSSTCLIDRFQLVVQKTSDLTKECKTQEKK